jgi:hypothetical protein
MARLVRKFVLAAVVAAWIAPMVGCGSGKDESKPNPDMKIPDIPPGGKDTKGTPGQKK